METDIAAIRAVLSQYAMSICDGDLDLWISLWADNGTQMPPDAPACIGRVQILEEMKPAFDEMSMELIILSIEDAKIYGGFGLTRCRYTLKMTPKAGGETINAMPEGKALTLYERQSDGSWKIAFDCFSSNIAPQLE